MYMHQTNPIEVMKIVQKPVNKNSSGYDQLSNTVLKNIVEGILYPLTEIMNKFMISGIFPYQIKHVDVRLFYNSKDKLNKDNYQPISLLLTLSRVLKKLMHKRTYGFLESINQLFTSQYGFRSKHSCKQAVSELISEVVKVIEKKEETIAVFLDLSNIL